MYLRKLLLLIGALSLLLAGHASALGLGDISLKSALNQPLEAHASLLDVAGLDAEQIIVQLASQEDFDRAGLDRPFFYNQIRFNVVTNSPDGPFIAITTREPIREPFLSFILDVRWSSGRLLREYTILLDLPVFAEDAAEPVAAAGAPASRTSAVKSEPVQRASQPRAAVSAPQSASRGASTYGPVQSNDTLWEIALQVRPSGVSVQQTMLAIQRANPEAFINNNINLLRRGQVLRIPADSDIRSITTRQAISEVATQNRQWSGSAGGAQLDASGRSSQVNRSDTEVSGRVRLASGNAGSSSDVATGGGTGGDGRALEQELATTRDELQRARGESTELRSRVSELEGQIDTMERLLEATNEQMRALELAASAPDSEAPTADDSLVERDTAASDTYTEDSDGADTAEQDPMPEAEQAAEPEAPAQTDASPTATAEETVEAEAVQPSRVVRQAPKKTLVDRLMENLIWILIAAVALVILIVLIMRKRQSDAGSEPEDFDGEQDFPDPAFDMDEQADDAPLDDESLELDVDDDLFEQQPTRAETGDVVGEADIYIALGKYDEAEEMLLRGLDDEPQSTEIGLKLLEVYAESNNLVAFDDRYAKLLPLADELTRERAREMRTHFADAPAFDEAAAAPALDEELGLPADDDLVIDDALSDDALSDDGLPEDSLSDQKDELDLDDDFTFDLDDDELETKSEAPASGEDDLDGARSAYDMSFDLDDEKVEATENDDDLLDFDLELEPERQSSTSADTDDELSFDLDGDEDELTLSLDDDAPEAVDDEDDFTFELDDDSQPTSLAADDELELSLEDDSAPTTEALDDEDALLSLDDEQGDDSAEAEDAPLLDDQDDSVPTLDLAEDDADDFDLDSAMGDLDLDALDKEMADLDAGSADTTAAPSVDDLDEDLAFEEAMKDASGSDDDLTLDNLPTPEQSNNDAADDAGDDDMDFLADADEAATKLDLARAYIDMGDMDGARDILSEVAEEGNDEQRREAQSLLERVDS